MPVVPIDPADDSITGLGRVGEVVLRDTLLLDATEEAFDESVVFRHVGMIYSC